ncbi:MAG: hypothetical protein VX951_12690 [Planctomycetota bacterium]|nr:hypothetical protein [Planctomycetota bacterium]
MKTSQFHASGIATLILVAALSLLYGCGQPQERKGHYPPNTTQKADTKFVRFHDHGNGEGLLETAIATYRGKNGEKVELISAVHVADAGYYARLAKMFESYDSLLYEMVKAKGTKPPPPGRRKATESGGMISMFQRMMRDTLKLEFQIEAIDYRAKNFVHADLDAETFYELSEERGESLIRLMFNSAIAAMGRSGTDKDKSDPNMGMKMLFALFSKDRARLLKYLLAKELQNMEELMAGLSKGPDGKGSVILIERNKQLMRVLHQRLDKGEKQLGLFYGGAHLHDVEQRIFKEIGLQRTSVRWEKAWEIRKPKKATETKGPKKVNSTDKR